MEHSADEANFFKRDFPAAELFRFYNAQSGQRPENREFCVEGDGWRRRFVELNSAEALRKLVEGKGVKALHAGAVFEEAVKNVRRSTVEPMGKELVFDLDLQDNPWVAGEKEDMAHNDRFLPLLFASASILKLALEQVYGFKQFMAVYSGRRGLHLYVLDRRAFLLTAEQRHAVCESLSLKPQSSDSPFISSRLWPSLSSPEMECAVKAAWAAAVGEAEGECGMLASKVDVARFAELFAKWKPPPGWKSPPQTMSSDAVFARLCTEPTLQERIDSLGKINRFAARDLVLSVVWPRLDVQVTSSIQHTLKTPFSLHAATRRVATPVLLDAFRTPAANGGWRPMAASLESWRSDEEIREKALSTMRKSTLLVEFARIVAKKRRRTPENITEASRAVEAW